MFRQNNSDQGLYFMLDIRWPFVNGGLVDAEINLMNLYNNFSLKKISPIFVKIRLGIVIVN